MFSLKNIPPITKNLLLANVFLFIATYILEQKGVSLSIVLGAFFPESVNFYPHQILSHMFMHGGFAHLAFNMYGLFAFGSMVENQLDSKKFMILYFAAGLGSFFLHNLVEYYNYQDLVSVLANYNIPEEILDKYAKLNFFYKGSLGEQINENGNKFLNYLIQRGVPVEIVSSEKISSVFRANTIPMVGASGAIYGVLVAFAVLFSEARLSIIFLPFFSLKAKHFVPILIGIDLYLGMARPAWDPVAHFAHIGGAIIGLILIVNWKKNFNRWN